LQKIKQMVTLHDNSVIRPDIDLNNIVEVNLKNVFGNYISYLKNKYIREDGQLFQREYLNNLYLRIVTDLKKN